MIGHDIMNSREYDNLFPDLQNLQKNSEIVYEFIKENPNCSRYEILVAIHFPLHYFNEAINYLIVSGKIKITKSSDTYIIFDDRP
jgi:hypothetical protein